MTERKAYFSEDRVYRYRLDIWWSNRNPARLNFIMLNPSTADEVDNDPTVERCERRARMWGFGGVIITNLFAYRSTDPQTLYGLDRIKAIGNVFRGHYTNNDHILTACIDSDMTIAGWGQHGKLHGRDKEVKDFLLSMGVDLYYLRLANNGSPYHPLYLPYTLTPQEWR